MNEQPKPNKKPFFYYAMIAMLILMLLNAFVFPSLMTPRVTEVSYDKFLDMLSGGQVTVVELQENERELYFKAADENGAERIYSTGVFPDADLQKRLSESGVTFSAVAPQENSTLMNFLFTWIFPTLILILPMVLLWRMMQKRMGGGSDMMSFGMGKSNAKIYVASPDGQDLCRCGRAGRGQGSAGGDRGFPAQPGEIRADRREAAQGRAAGGPSRHRQDAAGQGRGRRGQRAVLLHLRLASLWRCSWAWARPRCATCSSRPRKRPPASCSSTRSTPSAKSATPAASAATTSASRR